MFAAPSQRAESRRKQGGEGEGRTPSESIFLKTLRSEAYCVFWRSLVVSERIPAAERSMSTGLALRTKEKALRPVDFSTLTPPLRAGRRASGEGGATGRAARQIRAVRSDSAGPRGPGEAAPRVNGDGAARADSGAAGPEQSQSGAQGGSPSAEPRRAARRRRRTCCRCSPSCWRGRRRGSARCRPWSRPRWRQACAARRSSGCAAAACRRRSWACSPA